MIRRLFGALLLGVAAFTLAAAPVVHTRIVGGRNYVNLNDLAAVCGLRLHRNGEIFQYSGYGVALQVQNKKSAMKFSGMQVAFSYPVAQNGVIPWISRVDWESTLRYLLYPGYARRHRIGTIVLDPGHGGSDCGALGHRLREKDVTLRLARRTAEILRSCGYRVMLTRNTDRTLPLAQRTLFQQQSRSDLFISIHLNAVKDPLVSGVECYCLTPAAGSSSNDRTRKTAANPANAWDANNLLFAYQLQRALLRRTAAPDRAVKRARFAVLREIRCPGALVEVGFISNRNEEKLLGSAAYQEKLARGIAEGVLSYHRLIYNRK